MQLFKGIVRLSGETGMEVAKQVMTAPEVIILRHIHGQDALHRLRKTTMDKRSHKGERDRLGLKYGDDVVEQLFGPAHVKLPVDVIDYVDPDDEEDDDEEQSEAA